MLRGECEAGRRAQSLKTSAVSQAAAMAFPDARSRGRVCDGCRAAPRFGSWGRPDCSSCPARARREQNGSSGVGGMGWVQRRQALGLVLLINPTDTLKERINTLPIKFTDETHPG